MMKSTALFSISLISCLAFAEDHRPVDGGSMHIGHHDKSAMETQEHARRHEFSNEQAHIHDHGGDVNKAENHAERHGTHASAHLHDHANNMSDAAAHAHEHAH
ncbi:Uncharacterised protein [BD1-7 clade bacterium]|uniref:Uncharacterized protein n=1 Tax=BD1-7 clade bacterium TaxID=2029982 RepID=A0A5S9Q058_9GAMM|nr:Uncharacterised protein [BD1-7 clade bacterium]CAA0112741.1 Uncharacterised protein [BD1-7 clade bacterium]